MNDSVKFLAKLVKTINNAALSNPPTWILPIQKSKTDWLINHLPVSESKPKLNNKPNPNAQIIKMAILVKKWLIGIIILLAV